MPPPPGTMHPPPSQMSSSSVQSVEPPKLHPRVATPPILPVHASSSTISSARTSTASGSLPSEPDSVAAHSIASRLPKAPVFVQRDNQLVKEPLGDRRRVEPQRQRGVRVLETGPRAVSDLHEAVKRTRVMERTNWQPERKERVRTGLEAEWNSLRKEAEDKSGDEEFEMRGFGEGIAKKPFRGSILDMRPPTIGERVGWRGIKWGGRKKKEEDIVEHRADDYVGFLVDAQRGNGRGMKARRFWRKWLRRY